MIDHLDPDALPPELRPSPLSDAERCRKQVASAEARDRLQQLGQRLRSSLAAAISGFRAGQLDAGGAHSPLIQLRDCLEALHRLVQPVELNIAGDALYLGDLRLPSSGTEAGETQAIVQVLQRHGLGGVAFSHPLDCDELKRLLLVLLTHRPPARREQAIGSLLGAIERSELPGVRLAPPWFHDEQAARETPSPEATGIERGIMLWARLLLALKDALRAVEQGDALSVVRLRRILQDLVDAMLAVPTSLLPLHTIHAVEDPYYIHCTGTAALSLCLGRWLGLERVELVELGLAALTHDIGYAALSRLQAESGVIFDEAEVQYCHPVAGFRELLQQAEFGSGLLPRLFVSIEHHLDPRRPGGYPKLRCPRPTVLSRIVQVADSYSGLVTTTPSSPALTPTEALESLVHSAGDFFDPLVVRTLVCLLGAYPIGSVLELDSGDVGVVAAGGRAVEAWDRPVLRVVQDAEGREVEPRWLDLARETDRRIEIWHPGAERGIVPHQVLFTALPGGVGDVLDLDPALDQALARVREAQRSPPVLEPLPWDEEQAEELELLDDDEPATFPPRSRPRKTDGAGMSVEFGLADLLARRTIRSKAPERLAALQDPDDDDDDDEIEMALPPDEDEEEEEEQDEPIEMILPPDEDDE